jgi:hypothetical protein
VRGIFALTDRLVVTIVGDRDRGELTGERRLAA